MTWLIRRRADHFNQCRIAGAGVSVPTAVRAFLEHPRVRVVVLCGRNESLCREFAGRERVTALGWREDVAELMAAADVLIHNAGGLSFTEALVAGLPAITHLATPGHGQANARVLAATELAAWPQNPNELAAAIDEVLQRPRPWLRLPVPQTGPDAAAAISSAAVLGGGNSSAGHRVVASDGFARRLLRVVMLP